MSSNRIAKIDQVLKFNGTIIDLKINRLTAPGENYGSLMLSVDFKVQNGNNIEEKRLVAKKIPPNEFLQQVFNIDKTYPKEVAFYKQIVPLLQKLQLDQGIQNVISFAPEYYGSRLNLNDDDRKRVDEDAVLLLENLKVKNFIVLDRTVGVDLKVAKLVLTELAYLHAVPIALKLHHKQLFEAEVLPFLKPWISVPEHLKKITADLKRLIANVDSLKPYEEQMVKEFTNQMKNEPAREPFATIVHNDCWINNTMVQFEGGEAVKSKLVDFQIYSYGSPAKDVLFFLFTSVIPAVIEANYDDLVGFYHEKFISILGELKCDLNQFSLDAFKNEMDLEARRSQFAHITFMTFVVFAVTEEVKSMEEINSENLISEKIGDLLKERYVWFFNQFVKRGWIFNY